MTTQVDNTPKKQSGTVKIIIATIVIGLSLFFIGVMKDAPLYEVHKEVKL